MYFAQKRRRLSCIVDAGADEGTNYAFLLCASCKASKLAVTLGVARFAAPKTSPEIPLKAEFGPVRARAALFGGP